MKRDFRNPTVFQPGQPVEVIERHKWVGGYRYVGSVGRMFCNVKEESSGKIYRAGQTFVRPLGWKKIVDLPEHQIVESGEKVILFRGKNAELYSRLFLQLMEQRGKKIKKGSQT